MTIRRIAAGPESARYWSLVAIVNGWPREQAQNPTKMYRAWEWYAGALRAHSSAATLAALAPYVRSARHPL